MKNYRLQFSVLLILLMTVFCNAIAQTKIGVKAGVNFSNVMVENETGEKEQTQSKPGIVLGVTVDIPAGSDFFIQPAIQYLESGFKQKTGGYFGAAANFKVKASYIQLPVDFLYKPKLGDGNVLLGAGPYIGYGTGGSWKSDNVIAIGDIMTDDNGKVIFKDDFTDGEFGKYLYGKPFDYGANFLAGYEFFNKLSVQINAQVGLANLQPKSDGVKRGGSLKNTGFGFSLGYTF